jgi:DUF1016 N-terminal domain
LHLYWDLAELIVLKQQEATWGDRFRTQMSKDLKAEFPDMKGFSKRNMELMRQWFRFWSADSAIAQQGSALDSILTINTTEVKLGDHLHDKPGKMVWWQAFFDTHCLF